ncbi:hypothetical protein TWF281_006611 [Arthrobotrys megalospora]
MSRRNRAISPEIGGSPSRRAASEDGESDLEFVPNPTTVAAESTIDDYEDRQITPDMSDIDMIKLSTERPLSLKHMGVFGLPRTARYLGLNVKESEELKHLLKKLWVDDVALDGLLLHKGHPGGKVHDKFCETVADYLNKEMSVDLKSAIISRARNPDQTPWLLYKFAQVFRGHGRPLRKCRRAEEGLESSSESGENDSDDSSKSVCIITPDTRSKLNSYLSRPNRYKLRNQIESEKLAAPQPRQPETNPRETMDTGLELARQIIEMAPKIQKLTDQMETFVQLVENSGVRPSTTSCKRRRNIIEDSDTDEEDSPSPRRRVKRCRCSVAKQNKLSRTDAPVMREIDSDTITTATPSIFGGSVAYLPLFLCSIGLTAGMILLPQLPR